MHPLGKATFKRFGKVKLMDEVLLISASCRKSMNKLNPSQRVQTGVAGFVFMPVTLLCQPRHLFF